MRSTAYSDIISKFSMSGKPEGPFDPNVQKFKKLVQYALEMAFNDFNFRTLTKTEAFKKEYAAWEESEKAIRKQQNADERNPEPKMTAYLIKRLDECGFLAKFVDYFKASSSDQTAFDGWHNKTCELFLHILDGAGDFEKYTKAYTGLAYGKAQKIVNMMFKHLYCLAGADAYEDHFRHCHMVLDNFTLEWFKREVGKKRIDSWSNLVYRDQSADHNDYMFYQDNIRNHFRNADSSNFEYKDLTPFQAEFYIWPEIQLHLAAESFIFELNPDKYKGKGTDPTHAREAIIKLPVDKLIEQAAHEIREYENKQK